MMSFSTYKKNRNYLNKTPEVGKMPDNLLVNGEALQLNGLTYWVSLKLGAAYMEAG